MRSVAQEEFARTPMDGAGGSDKMRRLHALRRLNVQGAPRVEDHSYSPELTEALLNDLSTHAAQTLGRRVLDPCDASVAFVTGAPYDLHCYTDTRTIWLTAGFVRGVEFTVAASAFRNILYHLKNRAENGAKLVAPSTASLDRILREFNALTVAHLLLHVLDELPPPALPEMVPKDLMPGMYRRVTQSLIFGLLHEQAHIEFSKDITTLEHIKRGITPDELSPASIEELAADEWALTQIEAAHREDLVAAATPFFFSQWCVDMALLTEMGEHPPAHTRLVRLARLASDDASSQGKVRNLTFEDALLSAELRDQLQGVPQARRYATFLRYVRDKVDYARVPLAEIADLLRDGYDKLIRF